MIYTDSTLHNRYIFRRYYFVLFRELTPTFVDDITAIKQVTIHTHIAHLPQQCHSWKFVIFQEKRLKALRFYNFQWVQRRHNCSPAASFVNYVMTLYHVKSASANVSFYANKSKNAKFWVVTLLSQMSDFIARCFEEIFLSAPWRQRRNM
jgi:hypothetical protein